MHTSMRYKSLGFTILEILVTIGIIIILAGIVFPIYLQIRENARQTTCLSNLRQLGSASLLYAQDFGEHFPPYINLRVIPPPVPYDLGAPAPELLYSSLTPYVKDKSVWFCPDDPYAGNDVDMWGANHLHSSYYFGFLKTNFLTTQGENLNPVVLHPTAYRLKLWQPSHYKLIRDAHTFGTPFPPYHVNCPSAGDNHFGGVNIFYLDGHAKWVNRCW